MPRILSPLLLIAVLGACVVGGAMGAALVGASATATSTATRAEPTAVAVVDITKVVSNLDEAAQLRTRLQDVAAGFQRQLDEVRNEIRKVESELEVIRDRTSTEALRLQARGLELQATQRARAEALQRLIDIEEGAQLRAVFISIQDATTRLAQQLGYDIVLLDDRANLPPEAVGEPPNVRRLTSREISEVVLNRKVLAASARADITQQLIDFMNNEFRTNANRAPSTTPNPTTPAQPAPTPR